ncbi:MAG: hypothetical protein AB1578_19470 [Thermodesulfobacteriota bacterium]
MGPARFLEDADLQAWRSTVDVNLTGAYLCSPVSDPITGVNGTLCAYRELGWE